MSRLRSDILAQLDIRLYTVAHVSLRNQLRSQLVEQLYPPQLNVQLYAGLSYQLDNKLGMSL